MEDGHRSTLSLEHPRQLLVIVGHHRGLLSLLGSRVGEETLDVLDGSEGFLPEFEVDGRVELLESSLEVSSEDVRVREVDGVGLVGVLVDGGEILSNDFAESSELGLSSVKDAELEGLVDDLLKEREGKGRARREREGGEKRDEVSSNAPSFLLLPFLLQDSNSSQLSPPLEPAQLDENALLTW